MHQCTDCGAVAAEPRLRYCEECGARMPEFKPPPMPVEDASGRGSRGGVADSRPAKPPYHGPKWLEHVPAHSPTVLGVILQSVAIWASILPSLASVGPFWSFVMIAGALLMTGREYRLAGEANPLFDWIPTRFLNPFVSAGYIALSVGMCLPMLEFSIQPLLWLGGTALVARDQWNKVFTPPGGMIDLFDHRTLLRGQRVLGLVGIGVCLLALFFTWTIEGEVVSAAASQIRPISDSVYGGEGGLAVSGFQLPMGTTVEIGLVAILVILMLRPDVYRPAWLRFVPAGVIVICLAWVLVNMRMKVGPIMFLAGIVPVALVAFLQAVGRDEQPAEAYAEGPPPDEALPEDGEPPPDEDFTEDNLPPPEEEEDVRG